KMTYVRFKKRMDANSKTNTAKFWGDGAEGVRVLHFPCDDPNKVIDLEQMLLDLPEEAIYMRCERLEGLDLPQNGKPNQQMEGQGSVYVQGRQFYARSDKVFYNQSKNQVIFESTDGYAVLTKVPYKGAKGDVIEAKKIIYNRTNGQTHAEHVRSTS